MPLVTSLIAEVAEGLGKEPEEVSAVIDEFVLQLHRRLFEYKGIHGDYIGEELHYHLGHQAFYHLLGFLDCFSERYQWEPGSASEYLLRLGSGSEWLPYQDQMGGWNAGKDCDDVDAIDASNLAPGFPFHVSVSDRLASDTDVWDLSGDYATLEEAVAAAKKIVDDQLEADFRKNPEDRPLMLLDGLLDFGFIPYVTGPDGKSLFNVRGYAESRCYELKGIVPPTKLIWSGPNV